MRRATDATGSPRRPAASGPVIALLSGVALAAAGCGSAPGAPAGQTAPAGQHRSASASASPTASLSCGGSPGTAGSAAGNAAPGRKPALNAVQFVSASQGWVVGSDRILHTADGGQHWTIQFRTSQGARLATVDFTDASHGWVAGASTLLATTDGGAHWRALPEPCAPIRTVHFVSPQTGFAVAGGAAPAAGMLTGPLSGGALLRTTDGGQHWQRLDSPPDVQTACFSDASRGWLGAGGKIYGTLDGGRSWTLAVRGPASQGGPPGTHALAEVECAGSGAAWAELDGPGVALSHMAQVGYHTSGHGWQPIFAEQYTASPSLRKQVRTDSPSVYPGPFSAISPDQAVFVGFCPPCSSPGNPRLSGTAPLVVAMHGGAILLARGPIGQLQQATGAAFVSASDGWVVGVHLGNPASSWIVHTTDGGRTWRAQYMLAP